MTFNDPMHDDLSDPDFVPTTALSDDDIPWPDDGAPPYAGEPVEEPPIPHINWLCTGVGSKNHAKKADEPHMLPRGSKPEQPTTDSSGRYMTGRCPDCKARTVWKKVTL